MRYSQKFLQPTECYSPIKHVVMTMTIWLVVAAWAIKDKTAKQHTLHQYSIRLEDLWKTNPKKLSGSLNIWKSTWVFKTRSFSRSRSGKNQSNLEISNLILKAVKCICSGIKYPYFIVECIGTLYIQLTYVKLIKEKKTPLIAISFVELRLNYGNC